MSLFNLNLDILDIIINGLTVIFTVIMAKMLIAHYKTNKNDNLQVQTNKKQTLKDKNFPIIKKNVQREAYINKYR